MPSSSDEADLGSLSDSDLIAIWLNAPDPEHPTPREEAALALIEARGLDL